MKPQIWEGCYDSGWKGFITPASFAHPAKFARGLIERIFDHCLARGYLKKGDCVGDCFGGIGTGGIIAAYRGLEWVGVELEPKFVGLADENFRLHHSKLAAMGLPWPRIIQGDSREFHLVVGRGDDGITSPPFTQGYQSGGGINKNGYGPDGKDKVGSRTYQGTGGDRTAGNIETLKEGSVSGVISSLDDARNASNTPEHAIKDRSPRRRNQTALRLGRQFGNSGEAIQSGPRNHSGPSENNGGDKNDLTSGGDVLSTRPKNYEVLEGQEMAKIHFSEAREITERQESLSLEGREVSQTVPQSCDERSLRGVRGHRELGNPSQESGSLRQQSGQPPSALHFLPHADSQTGVVGGEEVGQADAKEQRPSRLDALIASPPYADTTRGNNACGIDWDKAAPTKKTSGRHQAPGMSASTEYGNSAGQIGALKSGSVDGVVSSPPYISGGHHPDQTGAWGGLASRKGFADKYTAGYGVEKGQIGKLQPGDVQAVVTSPPRGKNVEGSRKSSKMGSPEKILACSRGHGASDAAVIAQAARDEQKIYGESPGQIGKLKGGSLDGVCTIPPYDCKDDKGNRSAAERDCRRLGITREEWDRRYRTCHKGGVLYGETAGQIGQLSATNGPETYWQAMDAVYRSCYQVIKPGGVIVLVVKDYVKGGKRVPLCDDTVRLIEHIGFTMVERIHAMLVKETRHGDLFTGETVSKTERKSFFRRLHEKKPNAVKIDWEEVLIARRP